MGPIRDIFCTLIALDLGMRLVHYCNGYDIVHVQIFWCCNAQCIVYAAVECFHLMLHIFGDQWTYFIIMFNTATLYNAWKQRSL